jgi:hypothetical protein
MTTLLHILTRPSEPWIQGLIEAQKTMPGHQVVVVDLTQAPPDYQALVERIFAADSTATW